MDRSKPIALIGAPVEDGTARHGCAMGPAALRTAGIVEALSGLGHAVEDRGDVARGTLCGRTVPNATVHHLPEVAAWIEALQRASFDASADALPIFLGGDHSLAAGTIPGLAARAAAMDRPLFVLWLDAHPDIHDLATTTSGNLHGTPMAHAMGLGGTEAFPTPMATVPPDRVCMIGLRSVDPEERRRLGAVGVRVHDMRAVDEHGIAAVLRDFLAEVRAADGLLHLSFDTDFLDPSIAPAVGTTVPGGATFREAHLAMEIVHESGLLSSAEFVEFNPFLDERGRTALLLVDLAASLLGRTVLGRPTPEFP